MSAGGKSSAQAGFSLLEVLIALLVISIGMLALVEGGAQQIQATATVEAHAHAGWVAANAVEELRITDPWPEVGTRRGQAIMGQQDWFWTMDIQGTDDPDIRRLDIHVASRPGDTAVATLTAFLGPAP